MAAGTCRDDARLSPAGMQRGTFQTFRLRVRRFHSDEASRNTGCSRAQLLPLVEAVNNPGIIQEDDGPKTVIGLRPPVAGAPNRVSG